MAMDMPPAQVEYRIERPAPAMDARSARIMAAMSSARQAAASKASFLPALDAASASMSAQDRNAVGDIRRTAATGRGSMSGGIPDSYVGERLKLAMAQSRVLAGGTPSDVRQVRCRMVALTMDARAGAFVVGGERGAEMARRAIPQSVMAECRAAAAGVRTAARSQQEGVCTAEREQRARPATRVSYSPSAAAQAATRGRSL